MVPLRCLCYFGEKSVPLASGARKVAFFFASCGRGTGQGQGLLFAFCPVGQPWAQVLKGEAVSLHLSFPFAASFGPKTLVTPQAAENSRGLLCW